MAWPSPPRTWTDTELVDAALLNAQLRDALLQVVRTLFSGNGALGNSGSGETDQYARTIPANTFLQNGYALELLAEGSFAANGNTKTIKIYFDGAAIFTYSAATNGGVWRLKAYIARNATTTMRASIEWIATNGAASTTSGAASANDGTVDYSASIALKLTLQGTSTNDVIVNGFKVKVVPGDPALT